MGPPYSRILCIAITFWLGLAGWIEAIWAQRLDLGASLFQKYRVVLAFYPGSNQKKLLLLGEQARPQGTNQLLIKGLNIQAFNRTGSTNLIIEAPECLYHSTQQIVSSDGSLRVRSGEGLFDLVGNKGFTYYQTNNFLSISNQIQMVVSRGKAFLTSSNLTTSLNSTNTSDQLSPKPDSPLMIECKEGADWDFNGGLAVFKGAVRVTEDQGFTLTCEQLTLHFNPAGASPDPSTNQPALISTGGLDSNLRLDKIVAEREVNIQMNSGLKGVGQALCGQAVYTLTNNWLTLTEVKRVDLPQGTLTSSTLHWDRANNRWSSPPSAGFRFDSKPGLLSSGDTNASSQQTLTVQCNEGADWDFNGGLAVFKGAVRVTEDQGFTLTCEQLTLHFNPAGASPVSSTNQPALISTNSLDKIVAEREVNIQMNSGLKGVGQALCGQAVYTLTNNWLTLTEVKRVDLPQGTLTSSTLHWDRANNRWSSPPSAGFRFESKPGLLSTGETNASSQQTLTVQCKEGADWDFNGGLAVFKGAVRVTEDQGFTLTCEQLTLHFNPAGASLAPSTNQPALISTSSLESIVAEREVNLQFTMEKGRTGQAFCSRLVYTATNDLVVLTQVSRIDTPQGILKADTVHYTLRGRKFSIPPGTSYQFLSGSNMPGLFRMDRTNSPNLLKPPR